MALKAFPESLVLLRHQRIELDEDNNSPSTIQFRMRSNSKHQEIRVLEWIIYDIKERTCEILLKNVTDCKKRWFIDVEIVANGNGFPYDKLCRNCSREVSDGWTDYCQTRL
ncbi:unnamed protein product [Dovyalis caffra]|uniref:Uncharacterized protein n=1 Tax=Dovyalis caffra TaxID=77055 RepID=A0AAV1RC41_9ROSI|nr:unnamed protein product [Dovyalis caffra]